MKFLKIFYFTFFIFLLIPAIAMANGGPVRWTKATPFGQLSPKQNSMISLESEKLEITLDDDLKHYSVKATYELRNDGEAVDIDFGVPITWSDSRGMDEKDYIPDSDFKEITKKIRITVAGKEALCEPAILKKPVKLNSFDFYSLMQNKEELEETYIPGNAWCVATLNIPPGPQKLTLRYRAELWFEDSEYSKSPITKFSPRVIYYPFTPAGYWKGDTKKIELQVNLGKYDGFEEVIYSPFPLHKKGQILKADVKDVDFKLIFPLVIEFAADLPAKTQLVNWNNLKEKQHTIIKVNTKASSTLNSRVDAYSTKNLFDGNPRTAWCEGAKGSGEGEWLEFTVPAGYNVPYSYCNFHGLIMTQGYIKDQKTYNNNGKIKRAVVSECRNPEPVDKIEFKDIADRYEMAVDSFYLYSDGLREKLKSNDPRKPFCLRLTLDEVEEGYIYEDTCISEITILLNCS
ncbi:MAG: hypothetical protein V3T30_07680 [Thermodesulfobacteriota bacterium]